MVARGPSVYLTLTAGIAIVSTASIFIRVAQGEGASSLWIAAVRLGVATMILSVPVLGSQRQALRSLSRRDLGFAALAGLALALHFALWIRSLEFTTVAASTVLVTTNPLWVGLASLLVFRERLTLNVVAGIALTLGGTVAVFLLEDRAGVSAPDAALGNGLALGGAVCMSAYLLVGRSLRRQLPLLAYVWLVYGIAALVLLAAALASDQWLTALSPAAVGCMLALAVGPQLLGHTILNWALRHVSATLVSLSILGEPIGSALLAWAWFGELMTLPQLLAYALIITGIAVAARGQGQG
jgi:drug/metabolite transporter (DMT)-like permease